MQKEEVDQVKKFIDLVERIRNSSFIKDIKKAKRLRHTIKFSVGKETTEKIEGVNDDLFRSFLLDFRKIYMEQEDTQFYKIYNILFKNTSDQKIRVNIVKCREMYSNILNRPLMVRITINGDLVKPMKIIDDWFYGFYFHEPNEKKEKLDSLGYIKLFHKFNMISAVINLTQVISVLSNNAKKILQDVT